MGGSFKEKMGWIIEMININEFAVIAIIFYLVAFLFKYLLK